jgi:hypothetical protein
MRDSLSRVAESECGNGSLNEDDPTHSSLFERLRFPRFPNEWMNGNRMNGVSGSKASQGERRTEHRRQAGGVWGIWRREGLT